MCHKNHVYFQHVLRQFNAQFYSFVAVWWCSYIGFQLLFGVYFLCMFHFHTSSYSSQSAYNFSQFCRIIIPLQCLTAICSQQFWLHVNDAGDIRMLPKSLGHVFSIVCASPNSLWQLVKVVPFDELVSFIPVVRNFTSMHSGFFSLLANEASGFIFLILLMVKHMYDSILGKICVDCIRLILCH